MGKGSERRPPQVDDKTVAANWARAFGGKKCDCRNHEHQVCDVCQNVTGNEKDVEDVGKVLDLMDALRVSLAKPR